MNEPDNSGRKMRRRSLPLAILALTSMLCGCVVEEPGGGTYHRWWWWHRGP